MDKITKSNCLFWKLHGLILSLRQVLPRHVQSIRSHSKVIFDVSRCHSVGDEDLNVPVAVFRFRELLLASLLNPETEGWPEPWGQPCI